MTEDQPLRGVAICHYNRMEHLDEIIDGVLTTVPNGTKVVVCDDGSNDFKPPTQRQVIVVRGPNLGVAANKNRALWALQDRHFVCILEDDLLPIKPGWFEKYEMATMMSGIHHFCRVQDKLVDSKAPEFDAYLREGGFNPIYGPSPRGDFTFITKTVVEKVGAFNPAFRGAGYAHGEWSERVFKANLINHPNKWIDFEETADSFKQIGDTEGGRWLVDDAVIKKQLKENAKIRKALSVQNYTYLPLVLE